MVPEVVTNTEVSRSVADAVVDEAGKWKLPRGLVYVASIYNAFVPLAVRTLDGDGWGVQTTDFTVRQENRLKVAITSTQYAINSLRSGGEQRKYEREKERTPASYGDFYFDFIGRSVYLAEMGMVATFVAENVDAANSEDLVKSSLGPGFQSEKNRFGLLDLLSEGLKNNTQRLTSNATAVALIGLNTFVDNCGSNDPLLVSLQTLGPLNMGVYGVVASKARAVIRAAVPSGMAQTSREHLSQIEGGVLVRVADSLGVRNRVVAVGGLRPGQADLNLIREVAVNNPMLGVSILGL